MAEPYNHEVLRSTLQAGLDAKGWRQADLARALGVVQQTVSKWMTGQTRPKPGEVPEIEEALNLESGSVLLAAGYLLETSALALRVAGDGTRRVWVSTELMPSPEEEEVLQGLAELTPERLAEGLGYLRRLLEEQRRERITGV